MIYSVMSLSRKDRTGEIGIKEREKIMLKKTKQTETTGATLPID